MVSSSVREDWARWRRISKMSSAATLTLGLKDSAHPSDTPPGRYETNPHTVV